MEHRGAADGLEHLGRRKVVEAEKVEKVEWPDRGVERVPLRFIRSQPQLRTEHVEEERQPFLEDLTLPTVVELVEVVP